MRASPRIVLSGSEKKEKDKEDIVNAVGVE